jgi:hypothetical protein
VRVFFAQVVTVVGCDHGQGQFFFQLKQTGAYAMFLLESLVLNLKKEIVLPEEVTIGTGRLARGFVFALHQPFRNFSLEAS